jgi:hypothetical protein
MKYLKYFFIFESKTKTKTETLIDKFEKDYGTELIGDFQISQINLLNKAFALFEKSFIKNKIHKITLKDLGGVHGRWKDTETKKEMTLNPSIFKFKREFENGTNDLPYQLFVLVHEIGHCIDHIEKISFSKKWQAISGWKKCDRNEKVPKGYKRYIEKRKGREVAGPKKSNWIYKEDSDFIRKYTSRNPREDFADSFAFGVFGHWHRFKGEGGQKKMEIIKKLLKKID